MLYELQLNLQIQNQALVHIYITRNNSAMYTGFQVRCPTYFTHAFKRAGNANRFGRMCEFE